LNFTNEEECKALDQPTINQFSKIAQRCMSRIFNLERIKTELNTVAIHYNGRTRKQTGSTAGKKKRSKDVLERLGG